MKDSFFSISKASFWQATPEELVPDVSFVPSLLRRKLSLLEKAALKVVSDIGGSQGQPVVFASRHGEWRQTFRLLRELCTEGTVSPAGFSLAVHNATPGVLSLVEKNQAPYTAVAADENTLEVGLLEALMMPEGAILVYAEESVPDFYQSVYPHPFETHALALKIESGSMYKWKIGSNSTAITASELFRFWQKKNSQLSGCLLSFERSK